MLAHLPERSASGKIEKSTAHMGHNQTEPKSGNLRQKKNTDHSAEECRCLHCGYPAKRGAAAQTSADQKTAKREAFRNLVNAESREQRPFRRIRRERLALNSQGKTIGGTVNCQCDN